MKDKILQALKTKFKNLGFGDKAFQGVADYLAATVTEEAQIETAIAGVEPLLKSFQGEIDARVTTAVAKAKSEKKDVDDDGEGAGQKKQQQQKNDDTPEWAKALIDTNKALTERLNRIETGKVVETRKQTLEAKLKDAPAKFKEKILKDFARMNFEKDEDFESYLTETETDLTAFNQELADHGLGAHGKPQRGSAATEKEGVELAKKTAEIKNANKTDGIVGKEF